MNLYPNRENYSLGADGTPYLFLAVPQAIQLQVDHFHRF
jgi:hypothetical protein